VIINYVDCNCDPDRAYVCGATGEFYVGARGSNMEKYAVMRYRLRKDQDRQGLVTYWGVHFNGKHILGVEP
jgi:hypothetical protein